MQGDCGFKHNLGVRIHDIAHIAVLVISTLSMTKRDVRLVNSPHIVPMIGIRLSSCLHLCALCTTMWNIQDTAKGHEIT